MSWGYREYDGIWRIETESTGVLVATAATEPTAKTIVRDHNAHEALMEALGRVMTINGFVGSNHRCLGNDSGNCGRCWVCEARAALELGKEVTP